jgi:hypothetical protein
VAGGVAGIALRATAVLDPDRAGLVLVPVRPAGQGTPVTYPTTRPGPRRCCSARSAGRFGAGRREDATVPELLSRTRSTGLPTLVKAAAQNPDVTLTAVCGGSVVLAMAGLLEGRHAPPTTWVSTCWMPPVRTP